MKYCVTLNPNYSKNLNDSDSISFIPMECLTNGFICPKTNTVGNVKTGYTFFADGDIIMAKVTPCFENGNIAIVKNLLNGIGFGSSELYVFRCKTIDTTYLFYFLQNSQFKQLCISTMFGTGGLKRVSPDFIRNYKFASPSLPEQHHIASFLDSKCSQIDTTIEKEREVITKLKEYRQAVITEAVTKGIRAGVPMKDSGIEWIGEIPEGWDVRKIKYLININPRYSGKLADDELISFIPMECLTNGAISPKTKCLGEVKNSYNYFEEGDIIMAKVTPCFENGNIAVTKGLLQGIGFGTTEIFVLRCVNINTQFFFYFLQNNTFKQLSTGSMYGTGGLKRISPEFIREYKIGNPSLSEQQEIASFLDAKCSAIDATIQIRELAIEKLTAYKQSLIYECVTGKREVMG